MEGKVTFAKNTLLIRIKDKSRAFFIIRNINYMKFLIISLIEMEVLFQRIDLLTY